MKLLHVTVKSECTDAPDWLCSINPSHVIAVIPKHDGALIRITASECDGYDVRESAAAIEKQLAKM